MKTNALHPWFAAALAMLACTPDASTDAGLDARTLVDTLARRDTLDAAPVDDASVLDVSVDGGRSPGATCWPWDPPDPSLLRASPRRVYAHYFAPFVISIDNAPPETDYYTTQYLSPDGEGGIHRGYGGFLRERPLPRAPYPAGVDWVREDVATEIRRALNVGLSGFAFDVLDLGTAGPLRGRLQRMLDVARDIAPTFRILLVPDMTSAFPGDDATALATFVQMVVDFGDHPSAQHAPDGRLVLAPFAPERRPLAFWVEALRQLEAMGHPIALMPMPVGSWGGAATSYAGVDLFGAASWGGRTVEFASGLGREARDAHAAGLVWMAPVAPQDARPRPLIFTEANNASAYRAQWEATIESGADWVQVITWNDYSECAEISPSSKTRTGFYDLTAFYTAWFLTGTPPPIVRDGLYYFHRAHSMNPAVAAPGPEQTRAMLPQAGTTASDEVELLAFLRAPGTLEIELAGRTATLEAPSGVTSFKVPLVPGTPVFRLRRGGAVVVELRSNTIINNSITYQDPLYHSGASLTCPVP